MRICIVSAIFPPDIGGPSRQALEIANRAVASGLDVHLVVSGRKRERVDELDKRVKMVLLHNEKIFRTSILKHVLNAFLLLRHLLVFRPSVLHVQVFGCHLTPSALIAGRLLFIPTVIKYTAEKAFETTLCRVTNPNVGIAHLQKNKRYRLLRKRDWIYLRLANYIWVTTPFFSEYLIKSYGVNKSKLFLFPNFIETSAFTSSGRVTRKREDGTPYRILTVCRLTPWKGIDDCIRAVEMLEHENIEWTFVGNALPVVESYLMSLWEKSPAKDRIKFVGKKSPYEIADLLKSTDIFVLYSRYEPFGIAFIEAMAAGVPVIGSDVGGIPYVLNNGQAGCVVKSQEPAALAAAIDSLLKDDSLREKYTQSGIVRSTDFAIEPGMRALLNAYDLIAKRVKETND